jgi:hypothetical protein
MVPGIEIDFPALLRRFIRYGNPCVLPLHETP